MINLALALKACNEASKTVLISNNIYAFESVIGKGVSANLCEAIVAISNSSGNEHLDTLGRPISKSIPNKIEFNKDYPPFIEEAARTFKETKPIEEFELNGVYQVSQHRQKKK